MPRFKELFARLFHREKPAPAAPRSTNVEKREARPAHRESDIPFDQLEQSYIPTQTSLKGPFRTSGADRQSDQEFARGAGDTRWKDEDRYTNKSGDPRIGTHGRTYEPGESRAEKD